MFYKRKLIGDVVAHRQLFDSMDFDKTGTLKKWDPGVQGLGLRVYRGA